MKLISKKGLQKLRHNASVKTQKEIRDYGLEWCYEMMLRYPSHTPIWPVIACFPFAASAIFWILASITQSDGIRFSLISLLFVVSLLVWKILSQVLCRDNLEVRISRYECLLWVLSSACIPMFQYQINSAVDFLYEYANMIQLSSINFEALSFALTIYLVVAYKFIRYTFVAIASIVAIGILVRTLNFLELPFFSELLYMAISASMPIFLSIRYDSIYKRLVDEQRIRFKNAKLEQIAKMHNGNEHAENVIEVTNEQKNNKKPVNHRNKKRNSSRSSRIKKKRK